MKKEIKITNYSKDLKGEFTINNTKYQLPGTIVDETVLVELENKPKVLKIINPSKYRVKEKCPIFNLCGGCSLQHIDYEEQLNIKTKWLDDLFYNAFKKHYKMNKVLGMQYPYDYRNKNQMVVKKEKGKLITGMYEEGTHKVLDFNDCSIQDPVINEVQKSIKKVLIEYKYPPYDEDTKKGLIRHVLVKRSASTGEILVVIVTADVNLPGKNNFVKSLLKINNKITSIVQNINKRKTSAVLGEEEITLYGPGFIFDNLLGKKFKITSKSFYQINSLQTEVLYNTAIKEANLSKNDILLDAYSGVGTIGIIASSYVKKVLSVEIVKDAVNAGIQNAKYNKVNNISFVNHDATKYILDLARNKQKLDVIIMDPPRSGSTKEFLNAVKTIKPKKVIYISCNPVTQVEDLKELVGMYDIKYIQGVDMFPHTSHVESIVCLAIKE